MSNHTTRTTDGDEMPIDDEYEARKRTGRALSACCGQFVHPDSERRSVVRCDQCGAPVTAFIQ